ncbi:nonribosomal peptide synthase SidD [Sclerotinia borealis F-4128]|uniref:Nonribosomal peptide synthase SidD n=1 Tax=Sclerotinia borealis (strain F-4128) TaxID=1432307 RepID=W9CGZ3_SCLBF|nr:nonribosomal peptide synthase SidD [Sclerotinia borealis F-4128]
MTTSPVNSGSSPPTITTFIKPCFFPSNRRAETPGKVYPLRRLDKGFPSGSDVKSDVESKSGPQQEVQNELLTISSDTPSTLKPTPDLSHYILAWSLLLRYYTGQGSATFGLTDGSTPVTFPIALHGDQSVRNGLIAIRCIRDDITRDPSFLEDAPVDKLPYNTEILITDKSENPQSIDHDCKSSEENILFRLTVGLKSQTAALLYHPQRINLDRAEEVAAKIVVLIQEIITKPDAKLKKLSIYSPDELNIYRNKQRPVALVKGILIHEQILKFSLEDTDSTHPALITSQRMIMYGQLEGLSKRLAAHLIKSGMLPHSIVPICAEKSIWVPIAILAILRAGAAFVLLDPLSHSKERLKRIILSLNSKVLIQSSETPNFSLPDTTLVNLDDRILTLESGCIPDEYTCSSNLACIFFTSRGIIEPEGAEFSHTAITSSLLEKNWNGLPYADWESILQFSSYALERSLFEIFWPLLHGGAICVPSDDERLNDLRDAICRLQPTHISLPLTIARQLPRSEVSGVRTLLLDSDLIPADIIKEWFNWRSQYEIGVAHVHSYPQCPVLFTSYANSRSDDPPVQSHSHNEVLWIVNRDDHNLLVPRGITGEVLVGGPSIAGFRYYKNENKTKQACIDEPSCFPLKSNRKRLLDIQIEYQDRRLYKTGQLAYSSLTQEGTIVFAGSKNNHVKIIDKFSSIVVVITNQGDDNNGGQLVAFVTLKEEYKHIPIRLGSSEFKSIRAKVALDLSNHMRPSFYRPLKLIPRTQSGEINRVVLKALGEYRAIQEIMAYMRGLPPKESSDEETLLGSVWNSVLELQECNILPDTDFFMLGGDSFKAMKLVGILREKGYRIGYAEILEHSKLSDMAHIMQPYVPTTFSLVKYPRPRVMKKILKDYNLDEGDIEDLYASTSEQETMLRATLLNFRAMIGVFTFRIEPELDLDKTRLVEYMGATIQVVFKEDMTWKELHRECDNDELLKVDLGMPLTEYEVFNEPSGVRKFRWSIHHALFDDQSLILIWKAVQDVYNYGEIRRPLSPHNIFAKYCLDRNDNRLLEELFWSTITTGIFSRTAIIQAAWSLVLAALEDTTTDIVCRMTDPCRDNHRFHLPSIHQIVGPTMTTFPVKFVFRKWNIKEHLYQIHEADVERRSHQFTIFKHVIKRDDYFDLPHIIIDTEQRKEEVFPGLTKIDTLGWQSSRSPLSVRCIATDDKINIRMRWDIALMRKPLASTVPQMLFKGISDILEVIDSDTEPKPNVYSIIKGLQEFQSELMKKYY